MAMLSNSIAVLYPADRVLLNRRPEGRLYWHGRMKGH